jgi:hypothetical protein
MTTARQSILLALVVALSVSLTGCGIQVLPIDRHDGALAIQETDGVLHVAFCQDKKIAHLFAEYRNSRDNVPWARFLDATGLIDVKVGDLLRVDQIPAGLSVATLLSPTFEPGGDINLVAVPPSAPGAGELAAMFSVPDEGLPTSMWLHPDGTTSQEACVTSG